MQCGRCQFENMPGLTSCMRCGSVLAGAAGPIEVEPPRMAAWKKPVRDVLRGLRRMGVRPVPLERIQKVVTSPAAKAVFGVVASIIPGLGHLLMWHFKGLAGLLALWVVLVGLTIFFFGGNLGMLFLGLSIGVHTWIGLHSGYLRNKNPIFERLGVFFLVLCFYAILYQGGRVLLAQYMHLGHSRINLPAYGIEPGDVFVGRRCGPQSHPLPRGTLVSTQLYRQGWLRNRQADMAGYVQVIGLPGETVEVKEDVFYINNQPHDPNQFRVPQWLHNASFAIRVPADQYFISAEYQGWGYNNAMIAAACLIPWEQVRARAVLQWWPIHKRGFVRTDE